MWEMYPLNPTHPNFILTLPISDVLLFCSGHDSMIIIVYKSSPEIIALFCNIILHLYY